MGELALEQEQFQAMLTSEQARLKEDRLEAMRKQAWQHFLSMGLPSVENEVYRYLKLRHLFSQSFHVAEEKSALSLKDIAPWIYPECRHSVIVFVNGRYAPHLSDVKALPSRAVISSLNEAMTIYGAFLNNYWSQALKEENDPFALLNGALHDQGAFLYFPPKSVIEAPIQLLHVIVPQETGPLLLLPRLQLFVGAHSDIKFISTQQHCEASVYLNNQVVEFVLEEDAQVHYTQSLCEEPSFAWHLEAIRARLKRDSRFQHVAISAGSATVRTDYHIALLGENAEAELNGLAMLTDKREMHTHVLMDHQAPRCRSNQLFKNALTGHSRASFEGEIMVRQAAQKTEALQLNHNLLLDDHVQVNSKPNLKIFADDVKATHGATMGQLDPEQLFYMKARGFSDSQARSLLIDCFCEQILDKLSSVSLRKECSQRIRHHLNPSQRCLLS